MARTRIYRAQVRAEGLGVATRLITQVMYEIHFRAQQLTLHGPYTTGNLAASLYRRGPFVTGTRVTGRVGSPLRYAQIVHDGARRHTIRPARGKYMKFYWRRVGQVVYARSVNHPGQPGKQFLVTPLIAVAARHNMRVVVYDL